MGGVLVSNLEWHKINNSRVLPGQCATFKLNKYLHSLNFVLISYVLSFLLLLYLADIVWCCDSRLARGR